MSKITWSAKSNSSYLNGRRDAKTILGAVRDAIHYANGELYGEGEIVIYVDDYPVRTYEAGLLAGTARHGWKRTDRHN